MTRQKGFSSYDIIEFFKEVGAERVNERAVESLKRELEETVEELVHDARFYANYAGRKKLIRNSDVKMATSSPGRIRMQRRALARMKARRAPTIRGLE